MSAIDNRCWACGKTVAGGVCVGPHRYFPKRAYVSNVLPTNGKSVLTFRGAESPEPHRRGWKRAPDEPRERRRRCPKCGHLWLTIEPLYWSCAACGFVRRRCPDCGKSWLKEDALARWCDSCAYEEEL